MDVFALRDRVVADYEAYVRSFFHIRDQRIRDLVDQELKSGKLWPEPLIQLNPAFAPGGTVEQLVTEKVLHDGCATIFRSGKKDGSLGKPIHLHRHQTEAIRAARRGANYVLTTGTGSGKSLAYIIPIVDLVLREGSGKGVRAIVVYPMNALANSQLGELEKFLGPQGKRAVTFGRYTGQEKADERERFLQAPPDIVLTNFVMLELILTRAKEADLVRAAKDLRFLVLDELHTYRGRQGSDVALLVRRVRELLQATRLQCVGTSATLAGQGTPPERRAKVAEVATTIFGAQVTPADVIGETLTRPTKEPNESDPAFVQQLRARVQSGAAPSTAYAAFVADPLAAWIESTIGVVAEPTTKELVRAEPKQIGGLAGAAATLAKLTGVDLAACESAIRATLMGGFRCSPDPNTGFTPFAFRLHQFVSRGDTVHATLEPEATRYLTVDKQKTAPGDVPRILLPLVLCRECGQEYYCVRRAKAEDGTESLFPRELSERQTEDDTAGFLFFTSDPKIAWPQAEGDQVTRVPDDWVEEFHGSARIRPARRGDLPHPVAVGLDGRAGSGPVFQWISAPFRFCLNCGVTYGGRQTSDFAKLTSLGTEGRSTATTVTTLSAVRQLRHTPSLQRDAQKLLSFTDNRQDASLQAGHFNDFVQTGLLRAGLYKAAADAGTNGVTHEVLTQRVEAALALPVDLYAQDPEVRYAAREEADRALREVIGYRLYLDLQRGWRVTSPNLEQVGLLEIRYRSLDDICRDAAIWKDGPEILIDASSDTRKLIATALLDFMRRELAIKVDCLDANRQDSLRQLSSQHLREPWALDDRETLERAAVLYPRSRGPNEADPYRTFLSPRSAFGTFLRSPRAFGDGRKLKTDDIIAIILGLLKALKKGGLVQIVREPQKGDQVPGYQLPASAILWVAGDGTKPYRDLLRIPRAAEGGGRPNTFFVDFYKNVASELATFRSAEHTAQVPAAQREDREDRFRKGDLPVLFCSPTMELGVDISSLNVVHMRNAPPTPANYAQRSGRAGRSGQPAYVTTYCTTGSPHDQYFFRRPSRMVAGKVSPPNLDLANEDLVRSHVHAVWLSHSGTSLGSSLCDILDVNGTEPSLAILPSIQDQLTRPDLATAAFERVQHVFADRIEALRATDWFSPEWFAETLQTAYKRFDDACNRWRDLYRSALKQSKDQSMIILDASRSARDKSRAEASRREAEAKLKLLAARDEESGLQGDFYVYRYLASEGFLPGYNFPRLPLSAFIPARGKQVREEYLQRPRFLAISEFGPRTFVYHEGSRYQITGVTSPGGEAIPLTSAKICPSCAYLHHVTDGVGGDVCDLCGARLDPKLDRLFRLQNVTTRRRDRITSDEEERLRHGFEIRTVVRFADHGAGVSYRVAQVRSASGQDLAQLTYGAAATLWRINLGEKRRKDKAVLGYRLDVESGKWERSNAEGSAAGDASDLDEELGPKIERVVPYVHDSRNAMILRPTEHIDAAVFASLQAALKHAIQAEFDLEDSELAVAPLPHIDIRNAMLFYEASEGGAGVLRRLVDDPDAMRRVARMALELCHFDPATKADVKRAPHAKEDCAAACYDCLMSYGNQPDHALLDRFTITDLLWELAGCSIAASPAPKPRPDHLNDLMARCDSKLEQRWLRFLQNHNLGLPSRSQIGLHICNTRPDFVYDTKQTVIYVDGPPHDYPERQQRDRTQEECLADQGWMVIRFHHEDAWASITARYPSIFGAGT